MAWQATLEFHWGKHHRTYVDNLNKQVAGKPLENKTLEEVSDAHAAHAQHTPLALDDSLTFTVNLAMHKQHVLSICSLYSPGTDTVGACMQTHLIP